MGPLAGLRAVEIGDLGEVAGKILADAGADVVKVEPVDGARSRRFGPFAGDRFDLNAGLHYAYWNTNKRGVTLDISSDEGREIWGKLIWDTDVVVDSTAPGVLENLDLDYDAWASREGIVWCTITPFGRKGPWRDFKANDLVSIALGGPMMSTGYDDHELPPVRPDGGHSLAIAGEYAVTGILTALLQRHSTGRGQLVDVSIHEAVSCTTEGAFPNWEYSQRISQRQTGRHASGVGPTAPWQIRCADGNYILLMGGGMPRDERVWNALMAWMDETGANAEIRDLYGAGGRGNEHRDLILSTIHRFVESLPAEEVYRRGQACHLPWGFVRRPEENLDDPHWHDRGFFVQAEVPGSDRVALYPGAPYRFSDTPLEFRRRAPLLGEHNFEVYVKELGVAPDEVVALAQRRVI